MFLIGRLRPVLVAALSMIVIGTARDRGDMRLLFGDLAGMAWAGLALVTDLFNLIARQPRSFNGRASWPSGLRSSELRSRFMVLSSAPVSWDPT